jgi:hypothetical protein
VALLQVLLVFDFMAAAAGLLPEESVSGQLLLRLRLVTFLQTIPSIPCLKNSKS